MNRSRLTRPRVTQRIAEAAEYPVALIIAPAGFGKSVALRDYLVNERVTHLRYDVRPDQETLFEFVRGLAKAVEPAFPAASQSFASAQERAMAEADPVGELARWFVEHLTARCTIVIDDLHHAAADRRTIAFLVKVIDRAIDTVHWIVASRSALDLPLGTWAAYERMDAPVDETDLTFTVEEALAAAQDVTVGEDGAQELLRLTGGWPVAFSLSLRAAGEVAGLAKLGDATREMIYGYLAEQVYLRLGAAQRRFLLETSVYPWLDASIVEKRGDPPDLLASLRREAGFIYAASEKEFRYHDLFREFLENELRSRGEAEYRNALLAASTTLLDLNRGAESLSLLVRAGDHAGVLRVIAERGFDLIDRGRSDVVQAALSAIAQDERSGNAIATGIEAVLASRRGQTSVAEQLYKSAITLAQDRATIAQLVYRYAIDLVRAGREDAIALLETYAADKVIDGSLRASILATLATAYVQAQRFPEARREIEQALMLLERSPNAGLRARISFQAAYVFFFAHEPQRARQYADHALEIAIEHHLYDIAARAHSVLYNISGDIDDDPIASLQHLEQLQDCARKSGSSQMLLFALLALYDINVERGDEHALAELDAQIDTLEMTLPDTGMQSLLPGRAMRAAWQKNFDRAFSLIAGTAESQSTGERRALRWAEIALYALAASDTAAAEHAIARSQTELDDCAPGTRRVLRTELTLALCELLRGKEVAAQRFIADVEQRLTPNMHRLRALARAARALYNRSFDSENQLAVGAALERLRAEELGGIARLIEVLPFGTGESRGLNALTAAERGILRALACGQSSKQIAADSGRSSQTVDVHIRSICRKLNCRGRLEAISIAMNSGWFAREADTFIKD